MADSKAIEIWNPLIQDSRGSWLAVDDKNRENVSRHIAQLLQAENLSALAGCGCSYQKNDRDEVVGAPSMRDLWNLAKDPQKGEVVTITRYKGGEDVEALLSHCEASLDFIDDTGKNKNVQDFIDSMRKSIQTACTGFLKVKGQFDIAPHVDFIRRISRRPGYKRRFKLFTTNYDLCFEMAAGLAGFVVIDGFGFTIPRRFTPSFFSFDVVRNSETVGEAQTPVEALFHLYKLHGSTNWDETEEGIIQRENPSKPCLIYPANSKYQSSYRQPYLELISQFLQAMRTSAQTLLTMGFGFADSHLAEPILSALRGSNGFRLAVIDPCAKDLISAGKGAYRELKQWYEANDPRITFVNATFAQFVSIVPEIHKKSAEEQLADTVKRIVVNTTKGAAHGG